MATDFNISPYFDDYYASNGGLNKNYYKVLFRPGRALQGRELTTAQTILQNQIGTFGKHFFPKGAIIYGGEKTLHNPMPFVTLNRLLTNGSIIPTTAEGDTFTNIPNGTIVEGGTTGLKAVVQFSMPIEGDTTQTSTYGTEYNTLWIQYITSSDVTDKFIAGELLLNSDGIEVAVINSVGSTNGHGTSIEDSIVFTKDTFVRTNSQRIILDKYLDNRSSRVGYVVVDKIVGSAADNYVDVVDESLKDNASGYTNYSADGADRQKLELVLCSLGYEDGWVENNVKIWNTGYRYHKNKKIRITGSTEVFICVKSHIATSANKPVSGYDNDYWVQATNFIEVARTIGGQWVVPLIPQNEVGFSQPTYDALIKIIEDRHYKTNGSFTILPFGLSIKDNNESGIKLANGEVTVANSATCLFSVESGHAFHLGHEVITQLPENFVINRARVPYLHEDITENYTPDVNYGNYILIDNISGYFDIESNQVVTFYNKSTGEADWDNPNNAVATAKIRYFTLNSGRKSVANNESEFYPDFRAYVYGIDSIAAGDMRAMKSSTGQADTGITTATISQTVGGEVNIITSNVYAKIYDGGFNNRFLFPLSPGYLKSINDSNTDGVPVFYTTRMFDAQLVKDPINGVYELRNSTSNTYFTAGTSGDFGEDLDIGIIDPNNTVDLADENYTIYNAGLSSFEIKSCSGGIITIEPSNMIPNDSIAGETGCYYDYDSNSLRIKFPSDTTTSIISGIKLAVRVGITNISSDTKTYNPCQIVSCSDSATSNTQGYDSKEISLFRSDVYSIAAVYMADVGNNEVYLPTLEFTTDAGTFLIGEKVKEVDIYGNDTGVTGFLVGNVEDTTWEYLIGRGSHEDVYFTMNNTIVGVSSGATGTINANANITINDGVRDITASYELDNGQSDNCYTWSSIRLKNEKEVPSSPIKIIYNTLDTTYVNGIKTLFSIDSYGSFDSNNNFIGNSIEGAVGLRYEELPMYISQTMGSVSLRDAIDFRPIRTANTLVDLAYGEFVEINRSDWDPLAIKQWNPSPIAKDLFKIDYVYFKSQKAVVILNKDYDFEVITAKPGRAGYPEVPESSMLLWKINIPPYTPYCSDIIKTYVDNRRYTMKDISYLDTRITKLEKAVKLNTEEIKAISTPVRSVSDLYQGLERFKNGIFVDSFSGHSKGDVMDPNYKCSIDPDIQVCRPPFESRSIDLDIRHSESDIVYHPVNSKRYNDGTANTTNNDGIITLPYDNSVFIKQDNFTTSISVNPYNVSTFVGAVILDPESDNWMDTERQPDVEINLEGDADAWNALVTGVNERLEITLNTASIFTIGSQVRCSTGGTGKVVGNDGSKVVLTDHEGKFAIGSTVTSQENPSFIPSITNTFTQGGATGFGTQFGDWQTTWTGTDTKKDVVSSSTETRTITNVSSSTTNVTRPVTETRRVYTPGYNSYRPGTWSVQTVTVGEVNVPLTTVSVNTSTETGTRTVSRVTTTVSNIDAAAGIRNDLGTEVRKTELGDKVVDVSIVPYIREKMVLFDVVGLKPNTKHTPFFNGVDVSKHCAPRAEMVPNTPWTFELFGTQLTSDAKGSFKGVFRIPAGTFKTGERKFRFIDETIPSNSLDKAKSFAEAIYTASGIKQTIQGQIVSTRVPTINQKNLSTEKMVISSDATYETSICWGDPLAQTFLVDPTRIQNGCFVTSIDLYIANKPSNTELPIWIDIRSTENGYPSQVSVPGSKVLYNLTEELSSVVRTDLGLLITTMEEHNLEVGQPITVLNDTNHAGTYIISRIYAENPHQFLISISQLSSLVDPEETFEFTKINVAAENNNWTPTRFVFKNPVYLAKGEYAFVVQSNSDEYECYIAELEGKSLRNGETISEQPYAGVMFKSQNASTWSATQEADIAFVIHRAKFDTTKTGVVTFKHNPDTMASLKGFSGAVPSDLKLTYNTINIQTNVINTTSTNIDWEMANGVGEAFSTTRLNTDIELKNPKILQRDLNSLLVKASLTTTDDYVSPIIDLTDQRVILIENIINMPIDSPYEDVAKSTELFEYDNKNAFAQAKYISRSVILDEGMDANDMRVTLLASRRRNADSLSYIDCYMKIQSANDNTKAFADKYWYPMTLITDPGYSSVMTEFKKYEYKPVQNFWIINQGGVIKNYYSGDGNLWTNAKVSLNYSESEIIDYNVISTNNIPLVHFQYDEQEETVYYTYFSGDPYLGDLTSLKMGTFDTFKQYAVKIVMMTNNSSMVPLIKECKAIALT